jgi:hypothetical protein
MRAIRVTSAVALGGAYLTGGALLAPALVVRHPDGSVVEIPLDGWVMAGASWLTVLGIAAAIVVLWTRTPGRVRLYTLGAVAATLWHTVSIVVFEVTYWRVDHDHAAWPAWAAGGTLSLGPVLVDAMLALAYLAIGVAAAYVGRRAPR